MPRLFEPLSLGPLRLPNRIVIAPMCQYSAEDGTPGDWHLMHLGTMALSGAGLLVIEATGVEAVGRISPWDLGLYSDANEAGLARVLQALRAHSGMPIAIQLAHAGRKASCEAPWRGGAQIPPQQGLGWQTVAPSALAFAPGQNLPLALDEAGLRRVREAFVQAAQRAVRLGLDGIELHAAHGYLLHQFLSPLSNQRNDAWGGSLAQRMRFPLEVFEAVREAVPADRPVWVRLSATDWVPGGWDLDASVEFGRALKARGCAALHVSTGGLSPDQRIPSGPGYQVLHAQHLKEKVGLPTIAVGMITEAEQAESILASGQADAVALARGILWNPRWPWHAAARLGADPDLPAQYQRSAPTQPRPPRAPSK